MLRFAFHSLLDAGASRAFLRGLARKVDEYVAELQEQRKIFTEDAPPHGRMAFELGLETLPRLRALGAQDTTAL